MKRVVMAGLVVLLANMGGQRNGAYVSVGSGTSVVIMRSPKVLWAAVDSKEVFRQYRDNGTVAVSEKNLCKATRIGDHYAVVAGIASATNGFDIIQTLRSLNRPGATLDDLVRAADAAVPAVLVNLLTSIEAIQPGVFEQAYRNRPALQIAFLGVEQRQPQARVTEYVAISDAGDIRVVPHTMSCPAVDRTCNYFLGISDKIQASVRAEPKLLKTIGSEQVERLIRLEYADRPDVVGGPVTMISYTPSGLGEVREGACHAQQAE